MSIVKRPSVGLWNMARRERTADVAKLRGRVIIGMLTGEDAAPTVVPGVHDPPKERPG
jgi:hypothetical protein